MERSSSIRWQPKTSLHLRSPLISGANPLQSPARNYADVPKGFSRQGPFCPSRNLSLHSPGSKQENDRSGHHGHGLHGPNRCDKIHATEETNFDTGVVGLRALKSAKVSDAVIRAMINPHPIAAPARNTGPATSSQTRNESPDEVGVYLMLPGNLTEMEPEIVGWQTGGVLKRDVTLGMTEGHVNGKIMKPRSLIQVSTPLVFVIRTAEGTSVTEYQLLRLDEKSNRREFRALTGGIIHSSGGAEKKRTPFHSSQKRSGAVRGRFD